MLIIGIAVFWGGRIADILYSKDFEYYSAMEANWLWRDKYGHFSVPKNIACSIAAFALMLLMVQFDEIGNIISGGAMIITGVASFAIAYANKTGNEKARKVQHLVLDEINARMIRDGEKSARAYIQFMPWIKSHDRSFYSLFAFVYSTAQDPQMASEEVERKLIELSYVSRDKRFPK